MGVLGREDWMIFRGPGFLAVICFGSTPTSFSVFLCVAGRAYWQEIGGRGWVGSRIIRPEESPALYKSLNNIWSVEAPPRQWQTDKKSTTTFRQRNENRFWIGYTVPVKDSAAVAQRESNDDLSENFPCSLFLQVSLLHDQIKQVLQGKKITACPMQYAVS